MAAHRYAWGIGVCLPLAWVSFLAAQTITWDMSAVGRFDPTNKTYAISSGQVVVDIRRDGSLCPTGLGELTSGREPVREIRIIYSAKQPADQWLHVTWDPGGSGKEQFEVLCNGASIGKSDLVDASQAPTQNQPALFSIRSVSGPNTIVLKHLSGDGLRFSELSLTGSKAPSHRAKPNLAYPTLESFEKAIGQPGVLLEAEHVMLLAPKSREQAAHIVLPYLVRAYNELYKIVGVHTKYKIAVYAFPQGNPQGWGGTSVCSIEYDDKNLDLANTPEWKRYKVPHVSGLIEEMAHNFVDATGVQFGWEMIGWTLSVKVAQKVAPNPIFARDLRETRKGQLQTYQRYNAADHILPKDVLANQCDRIHAHLLWLAEQQYGPNFWPDFFGQVREAKEAFAMASRSSEDNDQARNARYLVTIDCFDKMPKIQFKKMLSDNGISLTTDVKSLHPEKPGWNRKLQ